MQIKQMENSKLIQLIKTFSAKELRECGEFVHSSFFNKHEEFSALYDYLKSCAPKFLPKNISRETVYKNLFSKKRYDEKHINHLMSFLLKLVEQYIGYKQFSNNEILQQINILNAYVEKGLDKHYSYVYDLTQVKLIKYPYRNVEFYYLQYLLSETDNQYFLRQKIRKYDVRLQSAADYFDLYLLAGKLKYFCEMQDRKMSLNANYKLKMTGEISSALTKINIEEYSGIRVYWIILQMLENPEEPAHFYQLKKLIAVHHDDFPPAELKELYFYAINYCIRKVNVGEQDFLKELFTLYKIVLEADLLLENNQISPWTYKNLVGVALRLKEFNWVEKFIKEKNVLLAAEFRDNALHYNLAELFYYKHDFDIAMSHLNKVEFSDIYYSLDTKKMMVKIYFEQNTIDPLLSLIASFKIFIKRNKSVSEANKQAYNNFISVIHLFIKFQNQKTSPVLKSSIENLKPLADRNWLLEQYHVRFKR
jgi:hypothetical protein